LVAETRDTPGPEGSVRSLYGSASHGFSPFGQSLTPQPGFRRRNSSRRP
jgi:hypothetical protein